MVRFDGREWNEIRKMDAKIGISEDSDGSAYFRFGNTIAYAYVYGPKFVKSFNNVDKGLIRIKYDMLPFSTPERKKNPVSRREIEISSVIKRAIEKSIILEEIPNTITDIYVRIINADAGTRTASINAISLALIDAGIPLRYIPVAVAVGKVGQKIVIDLNKKEEDYDSEKLKGTEYEKYIEYYGEGKATDIPVCIDTLNKKFTLIQLDGDINSEELKQALNLALEKSQEILNVIRNVILSKYPEDEIIL